MNKSTEQIEWTDGDKEVLHLGRDTRDCGPVHFEDLDDPLARQCWEDVRLEMLDDCIRKLSPGTRPLAWWKFESPLQTEPRKQICAPGANLAVSSLLPSYGDGFEYPVDYLRRLGLLEPMELRRLEENDRG